MVLDASRFDSDFKYKVAAQPGAENVKACFTCGVCTAGCPVSEIDEEYNPRKLVRMIVWGMKEELLSSDLIWLCNQCYECYAQCPQDVKFTDVITVLRRMAVEEGYADKSYLQTAEDVDLTVQKIRNRLMKRLLSRMRSQPEAECEDETDSLCVEALLAEIVGQTTEEG